MPYIQLVGILLVLHGSLGFVIYTVTEFLFAFSSYQARMVPIVEGGFVAVGVCELAAGAAVRAMLVCAAVAWSLAVVVEWRISLHLAG